MRRVAAEIGAGTMTLYHYVRTKDELDRPDGRRDHGRRSLIPDGELPGHWREAIEMIGRRSHEVFQRHPWALQALTDAQGGPNGLRHFEQSLAAVSTLDADTATKIG